MPRGVLRGFLATLTWSRASTTQAARAVRKWHKAWKKTGGVVACARLVSKDRQVEKVTLRNRRRNVGAGRPPKCPWLRQALYEWFTSVRYAIDWEAIHNRTAVAVTREKCLARFTSALIKQKAIQLLADHVSASLVRGVPVRSCSLNSHWFACWRQEYGLSMKRPNRKYKVPRSVLAERLEIGWLNVYRVRAAVAAVHGYDPAMENWDQSPFHHNESGSQNLRTLCVAGTTVPIVEGHSDTRARWTCNLTTWSPSRLAGGGTPYVEFMFKADGDRLSLRLREYARERGMGPWVSVATSEKGSYRTSDVLNFLERHLPLPHPDPPSRVWRIMLADDHAPHLSPHVARLCWNRCYIFIPHGGGVTPVVQTVDTDLNQHVKRLYAVAECSFLCRQMQEGKVVPTCRPEDCMDLMVPILKDHTLHAAASKGYLKVGLSANLDNSELDGEIVREAAIFWAERDMRAKINAAVADVREEVRAGRLKWTYDSVRRLLRPYPKRGKVDRVLEKIGDDAGADDDDEPPWEGAENQGDDKSSDSGCDDAGGTVDEPPGQEGAGAVSEVDGESMTLQGDAPTAPPVLPEAHSEQLAAGQESIEALEAAVAAARRAGAMSAVVHLENEIAKQKRHFRALSREEPEVLVALSVQRDAEAAEARKRRRLVEETNRRATTLATLRKELQQAQNTLRQTKAAVAAQETLRETTHAVKNYTLEELGHGRPRNGGVAGKKKRQEVMDRLCRIGRGLSAGQRNDFGWFKEAWDAKMQEEHLAEWPQKFAEWIAQVLRDAVASDRAFSVFVHSETTRCFSGVSSLAIPGS